MGTGTRLCSDLFEVGGQLFRLEVYPAGLNQDAHKYVSLFLTTPGSVRPGHLLYELSILDRSHTKAQHITESRTAFIPSSTEAAAVVAPYPGVVAGFPKFIKANFLHRNPRRFLPDDTLAVRATVKMLTGRSSFPIAQACQPQLFSVYPNLAPAGAATPVGGLQLQLFPTASPHLPGPQHNNQASTLAISAPMPGAALYSPGNGSAPFTGLQLGPTSIQPGSVALLGQASVPGTGMYSGWGLYGCVPYGGSLAGMFPAGSTFFAQPQQQQLQLSSGQGALTGLVGGAWTT